MAPRAGSPFDESIGGREWEITIPNIHMYAVVNFAAEFGMIYSFGMSTGSLEYGKKVNTNHP